MTFVYQLICNLCDASVVSDPHGTMIEAKEDANDFAKAQGWVGNLCPDCAAHDDEQSLSA